MNKNNYLIIIYFSNMKEFFRNIINEKVNVPYHFASKKILDKETFGEPKYHSYSNEKEADEEYERFQKSKYKLNPPMEITSKSLQLEYKKKLVYLNINLRRIFFLSIIIIIDSLINLKYLGFSELYIIIFILSAFCLTISLLLLFNIQTNVLLDLYGYSSFYLFTLFKSCLLILVYILKAINFLQILYDFFTNSNCKKNTKLCPSNVTSYFIIIINIIIFVGIIFQFNYTIKSLYDAFCVLILGRKTTVQKQHEINERGHGNKIEFDEDNINNNMDKSDRNLNVSETKLDTLDNLKTE